METVAIAIGPLNGPPGVGTLHTTTAASTVDRSHRSISRRPSGADPHQLSESLRGVIAQTLCRKIGGGRVAALEVLIAKCCQQLIREGKTFQIPSLMQVNKAIGMVSLNDALFELCRKDRRARRGILESVENGGFESLLKRIGIDIKTVAPQP